MTYFNTSEGYGRISKILHWVIMLMLTVMLAGGISGAVNDNQFTHEISGKTILVLVIIRLILRLVTGHPAPNPNHAQWEQSLASLIHWALYVVMIAFPLSGWFMVSAGEYAETGALPAWLAPWQTLGFFEFVHHYMKVVLIGLIGLHVAGALKHAILDRDGTLRRMWFTRP